MRRLAPTAALLVGACVPSVDLSLPDEGVAKAYAFFGESGPAALYDAADVSSLAVGDDDIYALTFPKSLAELQLPASLPVGTGARPTLVDASGQWAARRTDGRLVWRQADDAPPLAFPAYDAPTCLSGGRRCSAQHEGTPWCDADCTLLAPALPEPVEPFDVNVTAYQESDCPIGLAPFDTEACGEVGSCAAPAVPMGARYDVPDGEALTTAIAMMGNRDVFVFTNVRAGEEVVADRPVTIWGSCPASAVLHRVSLPAGGRLGNLSVGVVTSTGAVRLDGVDVTNKTELSEGPVEIASSHLRGTTRIRFADAWLDRVVTSNGRMHVVSSTITASKLRAIDAPTIATDQSWLELTDVSYRGDVRSYVRVVDGTLSVTDGTFEGPANDADRGISLERTTASLRHARFVRLNHGVYATESTLSAANLAMFDVRIGLLLLGGGHVVERLVTVGGNFSVEVGRTQTSDGATLVLREATLRGGDAGLVASEGTRVSASKLETARTTDGVLLRSGSEAEIADLRCDENDGSCVNVERGADARISRVVADDCFVLGRLEPSLTSNAPSSTVRFVDVTANGTPGFQLEGLVNATVTNFLLRDGVGPAVQIDDDAQLRLTNGRIGTYDAGLSIPQGREVWPILDGVAVETRVIVQPSSSAR